MESNRSPSAYQPNALPLGQTGSHFSTAKGGLLLDGNSLPWTCIKSIVIPVTGTLDESARSHKCLTTRTLTVVDFSTAKGEGSKEEDRQEGADVKQKKERKKVKNECVHSNNVTKLLFPSMSQYCAHPASCLCHNILCSPSFLLCHIYVPKSRDYFCKNW